MTLALALLLPLAAAMVLALPGARHAVAPATPWLPLAALAAAVAPPEPMVLDALLLGLAFALDFESRLLLAACALIWLCAGWRLVRIEPNVPGVRLAAWHLTMFGNFGALAAAEGTGFYLFFAVLSIAVYGVLVRDPQGRAAGRLYLAVALTAELLFLAGIMLLALDRPSVWAAFLVLFGLGAKLGLLPLHFPLPPAYAAAGPAGGAIFAGALTIAAAAGIIRFLPLTAPQPVVGGYAVIAGLAAAFLAAAAGALQRDPRALLGYSTISQMGIFTVAIGLGTVSPDPWPAAALTLFALHHGLVKAALMLGSGIGGRHSLTVMALLSLALAAAPYSGGALSKAWFEQLPALAPESLAILAHVLLPLTSCATAVLMARFVWLMRGAPPAGGLAPFLLLAGVALLAPVAAASWLHPHPQELLKSPWSGLWPLLLAAGLLAGGAVLVRRLPRLPPGDIAVLAPQVTSVLSRLAVPTVFSRLRPPVPPRWPLEIAEQRLRRLPVTGLVFFAVLFAFVLAWL